MSGLAVPNLFAHGYHLRSVFDGERSDRGRGLGDDLRLVRRCSKQNHQEVHLQQLILAILVSVSEAPQKAGQFLTKVRIRTLVAWITLLQIPRTLIKFWQVWIKHLFVTYEQSYKDILELAQPEPFEVGRLICSLIVASN